MRLDLRNAVAAAFSAAAGALFGSRGALLERLIRSAGGVLPGAAASGFVLIITSRCRVSSLASCCGGRWRSTRLAFLGLGMERNRIARRKRVSQGLVQVALGGLVALGFSGTHAHHVSLPRPGKLGMNHGLR